MKPAIPVLEALVETIQTRKVWTLATTILVMACTYIGNFVTTAPQDYGEHLRFQLRINQTIEEGNRIESIFRVLNESQKNVGATLSYYQNNFGGRPIIKRSPTSAIEEGIKGILETSNSLAMTLGTLNGTHLDSAELELYRKEFIATLEKEKAIISTLALFYMAQASRNEAEIRKACGAIAAMDNHSSEVSSQLIALIQGFGDKATALHKEFELAAIEKKSALERFSSRIWIFLCCLIYAVGYGITVAVAYIKAVRQSDPSPIIAA